MTTYRSLSISLYEMACAIAINARSECVFSILADSFAAFGYSFWGLVNSFTAFGYSFWGLVNSFAAFEYSFSVLVNPFASFLGK
ncbi:hypothetical protein [Phormidesmis priestleyi]